MLFTILLVATAALGAVSAPRQYSPPPPPIILSGQYTCVTESSYSLCQNQWGAGNGVGSQTSTLSSANTQSITWETTFNWANNSDEVKSYANVVNPNVSGMPLSNITSLPASWDWSYDGSSNGLVADVSYHIWLGNSSTGAPASNTSKYEIAIWLGSMGGAQPIGSLLTTNVEIDNVNWNLWSGNKSSNSTNYSTWEVYSFVPTITGAYDSFHEDLLPFFTYLIQNQGVSMSLYLNAVQGGIEVFVGSAELIVDYFSISLS